MPKIKIISLRIARERQQRYFFLCFYVEKDKEKFEKGLSVIKKQNISYGVSWAASTSVGVNMWPEYCISVCCPQYEILMPLTREQK